MRKKYIVASPQMYRIIPILDFGEGPKKCNLKSVLKYGHDEPDWSHGKSSALQWFYRMEIYGKKMWTNRPYEGLEVPWNLQVVRSKPFRNITRWM